MKEVPFPVAQARRRARRAAKPAPPSLGWKKPDPFHISVEERRRPVLRERPVLFWTGP